MKRGRETGISRCYLCSYFRLCTYKLSTYSHSDSSRVRKCRKILPSVILDLVNVLQKYTGVSIRALSNKACLDVLALQPHYVTRPKLRFSPRIKLIHMEIMHVTINLVSLKHTLDFRDT